MGKSNFQNLKRELAPSVRNDIKNLIAKKGLPAAYKGGSCGTSSNDDDSLYINLDVMTNKGTVKVYISFRYNLERLFGLSSFLPLDKRAKINAYDYFGFRKRLGLARIRIMRAVYEVINDVLVNPDVLNHIESVRSVDADIDESKPDILYTVLPKY